jgi:hypothetical protein
MRTVKILSVLVGGMIVLMAGFFAVLLSIDADHYRGQFAAAVKQSGRDLILGEVTLPVFGK